MLSRAGVAALPLSTSRIEFMFMSCFYNISEIVMVFSALWLPLSSFVETIIRTNYSPQSLLDRAEIGEIDHQVLNPFERRLLSILRPEF